MRFLFSFLLFGTALHVFAQHQAIGLRLGEPTGLSFKKYLTNSSHALEVGLGWVHASSRSRYYEKSFERDNRFNSYSYIDHAVQNSLYVQARYINQYPFSIPELNGSFDWYWGVGLLLKTVRVNYLYTKETDPPVTILFAKTIRDFDLGPELPLGIEYTFEHIPLTLFSEISTFVEVFNRFGIPKLNGAIGLRYNFYSTL